MKNHLQRNPGFLLLGIGALLLAFGIYGLTQPNEFRAQLRIKLPTPEYLRPADDLTGAQERGKQVRKYCAEEMQSITSDTVLSNVVSHLNLADENNNRRELKAPKTLHALRNQIDAKAIRNTPLVEICVTDVSATDAAQIANLVAKTYKKWWAERQESQIFGGLRELQKCLTQQSQKVLDCGTELQRLKTELNLPSPEPPKEEIQAHYPIIYDAERRLEEERDVERLLTRKINIEKADLSWPGADFIEIIETAVPPTSPVRHKKALSAILIASGLLSWGWGIKLMRNSNSFGNEA